MTETTFLSGLKWLWNHRPDIVILIVFTTCVVWLKGQYDNFEHRLEKTEALCNNINDVQLPAIRADIGNVRKEMREMEQRIDRRFEKIDQRFEKMDAKMNDIYEFMVRLDTYLATTSKDYPKK